MATRRGSAGRAHRDRRVAPDGVSEADRNAAGLGLPARGLLGTGRGTVRLGVPARAGALALRVVAAAGLAVDAYVHADLAPSYAGSGAQSLFLVEAGFAVAAALLVLASSRRAALLFAASVAVSALVAVVAYRYADLGAVGPLPDLFEPAWYPEKVVAAVAEAVAVVATVLLLVRTPSRPG